MVCNMLSNVNLLIAGVISDVREFAEWPDSIGTGFFESDEAARVVFQLPDWLHPHFCWKYIRNGVLIAESKLA
jgi:hypothetical protein